MNLLKTAKSVLQWRFYHKISCCSINLNQMIITNIINCILKRLSYTLIEEGSTLIPFEIYRTT